jgi:limonene-1,2-epoxide hydrolase
MSVQDLGPGGVVDRLERATNEHDIDAIVACFATEYRNETPAHPSRGFVGRNQVRNNWEQILHFVPDLTANVLRRAVDGNTVWTEWEQHGTRLDGSEHAMAGVIVFGIENDVVNWARFYLEPVSDSAGIDETIREQVARNVPAKRAIT